MSENITHPISVIDTSFSAGNDLVIHELDEKVGQVIDYLMKSLD